MKTVQDWLREIDENRLADTYLSNYPPPFYTIAKSGKPVKEIAQGIRECFLDFVRRMKAVEIQKSDVPHLFFASKEFLEGEKRISALLARSEDVFSGEDIQTYSWILTDHAEVMGYPLVDTELARKNIYDVLTEIIHEVTFFGHTQEELEKERAKLDASLQEAENGKAIPAEQVFQELGFEPKKEDEAERDLEHKIDQAIYGYHVFCRKRELDEVRKSLRAEGMEAINDKTR